MCKMDNIVWLAHGGPGSGRYPEGSGDRPYQHGDFSFRRRKRTVRGVTDSPLEGKSKVTSVDKKDESKKGPTAKDIENFGKKVYDVDKATGALSSNIETIYRYIRNSKKKKNRASGLTDDELRTAINRIQMEQRYNELTSSKKSSGYEKTMAALAIIGSAATIAGTGIKIASGIKKLRRK